MNGMASQLSDDDKRNVSAWFAGQTSQLDTARNKQTLDLGQRIWRAGLPENRCRHVSAATTLQAWHFQFNIRAWLRSMPST